jgi:carbon-monoxide dehydrogenase large subunit
MMSVEKVKDKAKRFAGKMLEASPDELVYNSGLVYVPEHEDKGVTIQEIATFAWNGVNLPPDTEPGLDATSYFEPSNCTFPFGAHVAVVEVDADTGRIEIQKYISVDDCGKVINPMIVEGQVHGAVAQGLGGALYEAHDYDSEGQLRTASLLDYVVPGATEIPAVELLHLELPTPVSETGVKGVGEGGTIAPAAAIANAVGDALGVEFNSFPVRPEQVAAARQAAG